MSYRLVPLECPSCGASLAAENEDVVYYCTACRNGYRFDPEQEQLQPTEVGFIAVPHATADLYRPFWLLPATLEIRNRDAMGAGLAGLFSFFMGGVDRTGFPSGEGRFAVPAFLTPLPALTELTRRYTLELPHLGERLGERLLGGRYAVADAHKLAHFALISREIDKPGTLKDLDYSIDFGEPRLLGVPYMRRDDALLDALFEIVS